MRPDRLALRTRSPAATRALGAALAANLASGDVIALEGPLGSGKTEFVQGLAQGLEVPEEAAVSSPSFVLANVYPGRLTLVHLDLYRLEDLPQDLLPDLEEYLEGPHVTAVEWAERAAALLPMDVLWVRLAVAGEEERDLTFTAHGPRSRKLLEGLRRR
ncbi:MAG: tRNA (adenosine(37)-N6)-threonylcarbamoyltransferase complex ATPase subunit type 1 TsaE [Deltaproteobacteria bacterium]|nr:tRNA (adenosine(37)-N6)-threonylcarbamoyltransferase complex ATPase subunit type 1 TsaE [Deltaproteobacteria bacterium]